MSLATNPVTTILPVADPERERKFYEEALGLPYRGKDPEGQLEFTLGGSAKLSLMPDPEAKASAHTVLSFEVPDIKAAIDELGGHGVKFEDYDQPNLKTVDHIAEHEGSKACWFMDPEGNVLCLHEGGATEYSL